MEPLRLRRMPLLAAACCFAIGIACAHTWIPASLLAITTTTLALLVLAALALAKRIALLPLAALWIAAGIISWQWHLVPSAQHELQQFADGLSRDVRARVVRVRQLPPQTALTNTDSDPTWWQESEPQATNTLSVDLTVDTVEEVTPDISRMIPVSGGVRTTFLAGESPLPALACGDIITLPLRLRIPQRYNDPGAWQYADYLLVQGIGTHATARTTKLELVEHGAASLSCRLTATQDWASQRMRNFIASSSNQGLPRLLRLSTNDGAMLSAMLFGDRTHLTQQLRIGFERTGSFHLFVVSGMHVALLAAMLLSIFRILRVREWLAAIITIPAITAYALLTGFGATVQRALFMTTIFLGARLLSRERSVLNALGAAALAELIWSPQALFEAS
ncbi:MAG TPA: ComEC/Rec2 family competence protein, partial [Terriglobus sp.]